MPTTGTEHSVRYLEMLGEVREISAKYADTYIILWVGDMNASFNRSSPTTRDRIFMEHCASHSICHHQTDVDQTFHHSSGSSSQIDYVLQLTSQLSIINSTSVDSRSPLNTSPHDAVLADLIISAPPLKSMKKLLYHHTLDPGQALPTLRNIVASLTRSCAFCIARVLSYQWRQCSKGSIQSLLIQPGRLHVRESPHAENPSGHLQ